MIGCKVTRTLASVEFEIILILGLPCCLSSSSVVSTLVFVHPEISTQADGAQSSRFPIPLLEDPYLVETDTESEPFEDLVETETPKSPYTVASPTSLINSTPPTCHVEESEHSDTSGVRSTSLDSTIPLSPNHPLTHTTPVLVLSLRRTARMDVCVPLAMSPSLSANGAQSSRVPVPLPEDPYEAIRQAYLVRTNTKSKPFEGEAETPESPHIVAPPTCHVKESKGSGTSGVRSTSSDSTAPLLPDYPRTHTKPALVPILQHSDTSGVRSTSLDSTIPLSPNHPLTHTTPVLVLSLRRTARMDVCVPLAMSPSLSVSIAEVAAMSDLAFRKRFRSSYDSSPSPTLPVRKRYRGTSELILDTDEEEEDEEAEESLDSDNESEDIKDEGLAAKDEGPATRDDGLDARDEGPDIRIESLGLRGDEAVPEGQQRATPVLDTTVEPERLERVSAFRQPTRTTWIDPEDGRTYIDVPAYPPPALPVQKPLSPEWSSYSLPISPAPSIVLSPISSPMISLTVPSPIASPATAEAEGFLTKLGALVHDMLVQHAALQHKLQEMRGRVSALEQERDRREQ
nr:hypothetical protein [Tanacetum cinerariifolium]